MNNKEYWEKRQLAREELSFNKGSQAYEEYVKILKESKKEIDDKIAQLYGRYQGELKKLGVDKIQASTLLRGTEYKQWRYDIEKYGSTHIVLVIIAFAGAIIIYKYRDKFKNSNKNIYMFNISW